MGAAPEGLKGPRGWVATPLQGHVIEGSPVCLALGGGGAVGALQRGDGDDGLADGTQHGARPGGLPLVQVGLRAQTGGGTPGGNETKA